MYEIGEGEFKYYRVMLLGGILGTFDTKEKAEKHKKDYIRNVRRKKLVNNYKPKKRRIKDV